MTRWRSSLHDKILTMKNEDFWLEFAHKHRPQTVQTCRILAGKPIEQERFVSLLKEAVRVNMPPYKARAIFRFLVQHGMLTPLP